MIKTIGITGGIGSGKTTVSMVFESLGIPVFFADTEAALILETDLSLLNEIRNAFGEKVFQNGKINRAALAAEVFPEPSKLQLLNSFVHPRVKTRFQDWKNAQHSSYVIREAAILVESESYKDCDHIILVSAPETLRIQRVIKRNHISESLVRDRMARQLPESELMKYADTILQNDDSTLLIPEIFKLHQQFKA